MVQYAEDKFGGFVKIRKEVAKKSFYGGNIVCAPGQGVDGYGRKITSDWLVRFNGEKKTYRVYITQISNAGSAWIIRDRQKYHLRDMDYVPEEK